MKCTNGVVMEFQCLVTSGILIMEVVLTKYLLFQEELFQEETSLQTESKVRVPHFINMVLLLFFPVNTHLTTNETLLGKHP